MFWLVSILVAGLTYQFFFPFPPGAAGSLLQPTGEAALLSVPHRKTKECLILNGLFCMIQAKIHKSAQNLVESALKVQVSMPTDYAVVYPYKPVAWQCEF